MIVLFYIVVALLSFTRVRMWMQVALMLMLPLIISVASRDARLLKVAMLTLLGAVMVYVPIAYVGSLIMKSGFRTAFHRLRVIYFFAVVLLFVGLVFNLPQLVGIL
jgi:hypothetical protein